jgi:hypothetical protein
MSEHVAYPRRICSPVTLRLRRVIAILALGCGPQSCAFLCNTEQLAGPPDAGNSDAGGADAGQSDAGAADSGSCDAAGLTPVYPISACVIDGVVDRYSVQLTWPSGGPGVEGYSIRRRYTCGANTAFDEVAYVDGGATTSTIDLVQCWNYDYSYRILPVSACGTLAETTPDPYMAACNGGPPVVDAGDVVEVYTLNFCEDGGRTPMDGSYPSCCSGADGGEC